jgi:hypothetical protein
LEKEFKDPKEFFWARGSATNTRVLYDPKKILRKSLAKWKGWKPSQQLLEQSLWDAYHNMIEYSGKLRNGWLKRDAYLTRYSTMIIAQYVERALIGLNDLSIISENYLWDQILRAKKKPQHLKTDYPVARGLKATRQTRAVYRSGLRLCGETLCLIKEEFEDRAKHPRFRILLAESLEAHGL